MVKHYSLPESAAARFLRGFAAVLLLVTHCLSLCYGGNGVPKNPPSAVSPADLAKGSYHIIRFETPGTIGNAFINNEGVVTGGFVDGDGVSHGYILDKGVLTIVDGPDHQKGFLNGVSENGFACGGIETPDQHAAIYSLRAQTWATLPDIPGKISYAGRASNRKFCLGGAFDPDGSNLQGWLWDGQAYSFINVPGASSAPFAGTQVGGINDHNEVSGFYYDEDGLTHGFVKSGDKVRTFDIPGALLTFAVGNNNKGEVAGFYFLPDFVPHGFILSKGDFRTIDVPDAVGCGLSQVNDRGEISGIFFNADGSVHGFIGTPR